MSGTIVTQEDGSWFEWEQKGWDILIWCHWPSPTVKMAVCLHDLCQAGWDQHTYPALAGFLPLDAAEAIDLLLRDQPPEFYDPSLDSRIEALLAFARAWGGCYQTAGRTDRLALPDFATYWRTRPLDPSFLLPWLWPVLRQARQDRVDPSQLPQALLAGMQHNLTSQGSSDVARLLCLRDVARVLARHERHEGP